MASAKEIPPGGEGKIDVTLKAGKAIGPMNKSITVTSNDPTQPSISLQVKVVLEAIFTAKPERAHFGRINRKSTATHTIEFLGKELDSIKIAKISLKNPENESAYTWKINDAREEGQRKLSMEVVVNSENQKPGNFLDTLLIETDSTTVPSLEIMLTGEFLGPLNTDPQRVYFANYEEGQPMERPVKIFSTENKPFKILDAKVEEGSISIANMKKDSIESHDLLLKFNGKFEGDHIKSTLVVKTDNSEQPEIIIPIHGYKKRVRADAPGPSTRAHALPKTSTSNTSSRLSAGSESQTTK